MGNISHMATSRSFSKNIGKLNLQSILNIELFQFIGIKIGCTWYAGKLVNDVVQLWRQKKKFNKNFSLYRLPKQQTTIFGFQGILGVNP
jgi:hypothetical protein